MELTSGFCDGWQIAEARPTLTNDSHTYDLIFTDGTRWEDVKRANCPVLKKGYRVIRTAVMSDKVICTILTERGEYRGKIIGPNKFTD